MTTWRIYSLPVGTPGFDGYKPRENYGTVEAPTKMRALDVVAALIDQHHHPRTQTIGVLGIGSITVEPIENGGQS